jgi:hypothetical protein
LFAAQVCIALGKGKEVKIIEYSPLEVLKEIQTQCGNCQISFPKPDSTDKFVTVKGPKEKAEAAQKRILDIVADLVSDFGQEEKE